MQPTRRTRNTTRRTSSRRTQSRQQTSGGSGIIFILIGIVLIGGYFLMDEAYLSYAKQVVESARTYFDKQPPEEEVVTINHVPATQGNIAKILAYTFFENELQAIQPQQGIWYEKYYNLIGQDERFDFLTVENATLPINYKMTHRLFQNILGEGAIGVGQPELMEKTITLDTFLKVYEDVLKRSETSHTLEWLELSILGTVATQESLKPWEVVTQQGIFRCEGLIVDPYKDYTLKVMVKDKEVLGIVDIVDTSSEVVACYIKAIEGDKVIIQIGDKHLHYKNTHLTTDAIGQMATIKVKNSMIIDYELQVDEPMDTVLKVGKSSIEFAKAGELPYKKVLLYNSSEGEYNNLEQLFSGVQVQYTLDQKGYVETLNIVNDQYPHEVRVLISESGMGNYNHEEVVVMSETGYKVHYGNEIEESTDETPWKASTFAWQDNQNKVILIPKGESGLKINSIKRQGIAPTYSGRLEIYKNDEGYHIVNTLDRETYIAGVIPSEMPTSYGLEAAKVQAVAARSYVAAHQKNHKFLAYGAQVDDTVATQVYNNTPANTQSRQAAQATQGEVLTYKNQIISGNFFAASSGHTANYGETWASGDIFPTNTPVYLTARQQYIGSRTTYQLSKEEDAATFFRTSAKDLDAFDQDSPWFRWQIKLTPEELSHIVNTNVYRLTTQYPHNVHIRNESNQWVEGAIKSVGKVEDLSVHKRGQGGNIMELIVKGSEATLKVTTEYLIRNLLAPVQKDAAKESIKIIRADDSIVENMHMLPSAFFTIDATTQNGKLTQVTLYGGGFGHGVGMSQHGVKGMVDRGYNYKEILNHYYGETTVTKYF